MLSAYFLYVCVCLLNIKNKLDFSIERAWTRRIPINMQLCTFYMIGTDRTTHALTIPRVCAIDERYQRPVQLHPFHRAASGTALVSALLFSYENAR